MPAFLAARNTDIFSGHGKFTGSSTANNNVTA
jgi:hypothetical protein